MAEVKVTRTMTVPRPVDEVVAYLADFTNAVEWDPGTVRCKRLDDGPVAVGARWHNVSKVLGRETELEYRLQTLEPGHIVLVGTNKSATSTDDITVVANGGGTEITYSATIELNGLVALAAPIMKLAMERLGDGTVTGITGALG
jgi:carbon monoxide dehydrogenase subunit G